MDITQLGDKLGDIRLGDIESGVIVTLINSHLEGEQQITSLTTGNELKTLYTSLTTDQKNQLDRAIRLEDDPKTMVGILNAINHLETQRVSLQAHMQSSKTLYVLMALAIVLIYSYWLVYNYHLQAMEMMGESYKSNMISFVGNLFSTIEKVFFSTSGE